jgi:hypothetical protein
MHKLPIGIQDFIGIREDGYHYVDKTSVIHRLLKSGKVFFLSRPRRFGKSLLCSTLGAIFNARRDLFSGLAIDTLDWAWKKHPVIRIDLNAGEFENGIGHLRSAINYSLEHAAASCSVSVRGDTPSTMLGNLISDVSARFNMKAVVIIDEYDKPLLSTIDNPELHDEIRTVLKGFYGVLKQSDANLAFIFLAGVTKFSQVSVFSDLNQLQDISMDARFCDICGIRQDELELDFADEVSHYALEKKITAQEYLDKLRKLYNGYHFSESPTAVYNPFGLLNHFATGKMEPYWFSTGTPTFLLKLIENQDIDIRNLENLELRAEDFGDYRKDKMLAIPVLYQAGYLTISRYLPESGTYILDYPNDEVRISFAQALADRYAYAPEFERTSLVLKFSRSLKVGNVEGFMEALVPFFAGIPYDLNDETERHYQVVFYLVFRLLGQYCLTEVKSALGRADAIVTVGDYVYCFEFKLNGTAEEALAQIDNKGYLTPYTGDLKKLVKVGVEFDRKKRNVGRWLIGETKP